MSDTLKSFNLKNFDPKHSLFIEASAGTGKTYTIQLMVSKLISQGTPLKKILIVTYTEKAAGELKDRIRKKINEVLEFKKPTRMTLTNRNFPRTYCPFLPRQTRKLTTQRSSPSTPSVRRP